MCGASLQSVCSDLKNRETSLKEAAVQLLHKARKETNVTEPDELPLELKQVCATQVTAGAPNSMSADWWGVVMY